MAQTGYNPQPEVTPASAPLVLSSTRPNLPLQESTGRAIEEAGQQLDRAGRNVLAIHDIYSDVAADNALNSYQENVRKALHGSSTVGADGQTQNTPGYMAS